MPLKAMNAGQMRATPIETAAALLSAIGPPLLRRNVAAQAVLAAEGL
jgi:hypothetical protein